jgi:hypothetical protein
LLIDDARYLGAQDECGPVIDVVDQHVCADGFLVDWIDGRRICGGKKSSRAGHIRGQGLIAAPECRDRQLGFVGETLKRGAI